MSGTSLLPIIAEIGVPVPLNTLWTVLTGEEAVAEWLGTIGYRATAGLSFYMQPDAARRAAGDITDAAHCHVLLQQRPYRFNFALYVPGTPHTLVAISLFSEGADNGFVRVIHGGWDQFDATQIQSRYEAMGALWTETLLPGLKRVAERMR